MTEITDSFMRQMLTRTKTYSLVILKSGPNRNKPGVEKIIWEHGRRNFALRADGLLSIVCPVADGGDVSGIGIFNADIDEVKKIMDGISRVARTENVGDGKIFVQPVENAMRIRTGEVGTSAL